MTLAERIVKCVGHVANGIMTEEDFFLEVGTLAIEEVDAA